MPDLVAACVGIGVPADWMEGAAPAGPLAEFDGADTWVEHPYRDGIALLGDAAASNDPSWGNGLSLALHGAAGLACALRDQDDPQAAGPAYAAGHDRDYGALRRVTRWLASLLYEVGAEADARRARVFPLMQTDRSRSLDYIALGPSTPHDEHARRRFFAEDVA